MAQYCKQCGSQLVNGKCPICDEDYEAKSSGKNLFWFIGLAIILITAVICNSPLRENIIEFIDMNIVSSSLKPTVYISNDRYKYAKSQIPSTGENYSIHLEAGNYTVGQDIPEGIYRVVNKQGFGAIWITDSLNNIDIVESLTSENDDSSDYFSYYLENVRLYKGATINIYTNEMELITENAQMDKMISKKENELTETYEISSTTLIGDTIPAGTYDIVCIEGEGDVMSNRWDYTINTEMSSDKTDRYAVYRYNNVELNKDDLLTISDMTLQLIPSKTVRVVE